MLLALYPIINGRFTVHVTDRQKTPNECGIFAHVPLDLKVIKKVLFLQFTFMYYSFTYALTFRPDFDNLRHRCVWFGSKRTSWARRYWPSGRTIFDMNKIIDNITVQ